MFDWKKRPPGSTLVDLDGMPVVMLTSPGACVSTKTGVDVPSGRVLADGIEVSEEEFAALVASPRRSLRANP
ncbi:MAG: hypothetical protein Q8M01_16585 [Rubrivivax sp.]|nr:hypothetical protein [Rubrivivax sp.]